MKTKEFITNVEKFGLRFETTHANIEICDRNYTELATVRHDEMFGIVTGLNSYNEMPSETQRKLFNLLVEYASTPLEEREEDKEYYIKHIGIKKGLNYLNYREPGKEWCLSSKFSHGFVKTKFTLSELPLWAKEMLEQGHLVKEEAND